MSRPLNIFLLIFLLPFFLSAQSEKLDKIEEVFKNKIQGEVPGAALGIVKDGKIIYERYLGYANLEHQIPVDANTRFNIASTAKQFTALCILQLKLDGKLDLEDDFRKYLPGFYEDIEHPITIASMLTHSSGIRDYSDLLSVEGDPWWKRVGYGNKEVLQLLKAQKELNFEPGKDYSYSNSNYTLLSEIVAKLSGKSFLEYSSELFEKLGMPHSQYCDNYMAVIPHKSLPYNDWGNGKWQQYPMVVDLNGDGFLFTTLKDQLAWETFLQTEAENPLASLSQETVPSSEIKSYGYGLELESYKGLKMRAHEGATGSYNSQVLRFPEQKISVFMMSNNGNFWSYGVAREVADIMLDLESETAATQDFYPDTEKESVLKAQEIQGKYTSESGSYVEVRMEGNDLMWKRYNSNPVRLLSVGGDLYDWERDIRNKIHFRKDQQNSYLDIYYPGNDVVTYSMIEEESIPETYVAALEGRYVSKELKTDLTIQLSAEEGFSLIIDGDTISASILFKDHLAANSYRFSPGYDRFGRVTEILLDYGRNKNIRYTRKHKAKFPRTLKTDDGGEIIIATTSESYGKGKGDILLSKSGADGNEDWFKTFGGTSYEQASSFIRTKDNGYLIVGSTSSYGKGNYEVYLIKTDSEGKKKWERYFGDEYNEYGLTAKQLENGAYEVLATKQICDNHQFDNCHKYIWRLEVDDRGNLLRDDLLEEIWE
ncbi:MAG: serine hydrolase domain-containing protein [Bacteroidia bacterium]|nr:serine hydrolase domain-containing protein [Bacteroidia bacterium]